MGPSLLGVPGVALLPRLRLPGVDVGEDIVAERPADNYFQESKISNCIRAGRSKAVACCLTVVQTKTEATCALQLDMWRYRTKASSKNVVRCRDC